jgi:hypothetical protein
MVTAMATGDPTAKSKNKITTIQITGTLGAGAIRATLNTTVVQTFAELEYED